jgi:hypothetical protein
VFPTYLLSLNSFSPLFEFLYFGESPFRKLFFLIDIQIVVGQCQLFPLLSDFPFDCEKWVAFDEFPDLDFVWQLFELLVVPGDVAPIHITLQFEENQIGFD